MNILTSIIPSAYKHHIVAILRDIAAQHPNSRLADAVTELSIFLDLYASMTPARIALIYAFSSIEQEVVKLMTKVYLAILEMRGFNMQKISPEDITDLHVLALKILRHLPYANSDYKAFCIKNSALYTNQTAQIRLNNLLMDAYYAHCCKNIAYYKNPLINKTLQTLVAHNLLTKNESGYDFDNFKTLFLFLMLKLHANVNISMFLNSLIAENVDPGQFTEAINILARETWPEALTDALKARSAIDKLADDLVEKNDLSIQGEVATIFKKLTPDPATYVAVVNHNATILRFSQGVPCKKSSLERIKATFKF